MLNINAASLEKFITHQVGNRMRDEEIVLAGVPSALEPEAAQYFLQYLLSAFDVLEPHQFSHATDLELNAVYTVARTVFGAATAAPKLFEQVFIAASQDLAKLLYEQSNHAKIRDGKFNVVYFKDILMEEESFDAIGIFKSETQAPFLKMTEDGPSTRVQADQGYELKGMDKGCLIVNADAEEGYQVLILDRRGTDTRYWVEDFLRVRPRATAYHQTAQAMSAARDFLTRRAPAEFDIERTDQIHLLNKSQDYFAKKETFSQEEFANEVLGNEHLIRSFHEFAQETDPDGALPLADGFGISTPAYKKQSKIFKSILKLDKNFHIYIHGDREQIERGTDAEGRKFYKLFYNVES